MPEAPEAVKAELGLKQLVPVPGVDSHVLVDLSIHEDVAKEKRQEGNTETYSP